MDAAFASNRNELFEGSPVELAREDIHCWLFSLDAVCGDAVLDDEECARAERFRFDRDRLRYVAGRDGLRRILSRYLETTPEAVQIATEPGGRPLLEDRAVNFNFSRSEGWGFLAVSTASVLGADIEAVTARSDLAATARRFFSAAEQEVLSALSGADWATGFFNCWTRKEAVVKAAGIGLSAPLDAFDVTVEPDLPPRILRAEGDLALARDWTLHAFNPVDGYCAAVATELAAPKLHFLRVTQQ